VLDNDDDDDDDDNNNNNNNNNMGCHRYSGLKDKSYENPSCCVR
jgi:hypothetical protein